MLLDCLSNIANSLSSVRKAPLDYPCYFFELLVLCSCFKCIANPPRPPPPLPKGSFCSWNSAIIGTLDHDKTSISNVYSCGTEVAALFATVFPRLIMAATERLQGATLVGLDNREPPFETMVDEWHLLISCDCDY